MNKLSRALAALIFCTHAGACVSYSSIQKVDDQIYLSGTKTYFLYSVAFLKRCDIEGQMLECVELEEFKPERTNDARGTPTEPPHS